MAFRPEAQDGFGRHNQDGRIEKLDKPDAVDALVTDFLAQLADIASEAKPAQPAPSETFPAENASFPEPRLVLQTPIPKPTDPVNADAKLELEEINREIEATLDELERQSSGQIEQPDPNNSTPQHPSPPATDSKQSVAESPARQIVQKSAPRAIHKTEEQEWKKMDIFRTEVVSYRSGRRRRNIFIALVAAAMVLALIYFYVFREI